ncbi:MAG: protease [Alphaproteobacteria bacterium]|nr:MAG: protease [Alphaproteobacteria bacterium]
MTIMAILAAALGGVAAAALAQPAPRILQQPAISGDRVAFVNAGDLWTAAKSGGAATRLTTGVGVESAPIFSPDGQTIAFTGDYDGNVDVYTVPASGGVPRRMTWHPAADAAVAWSPDGQRILFRSNRSSASRYTQIFELPAAGGQAKALPLPMAFSGTLSPDGGTIAYNPLAPAFSADFTRYVAWGNYRGGQAGTIALVTLAGLASTEVPHTDAADFSPVWLGGKLYFLSGRNGPIGVFSYDPATKAVAEVWRNPGPANVRTLATDGRELVFDRLGELFTLAPGGTPQRLAISVEGDMPDVRARILNVAEEVQAVHISPTGLRAVVEAHGEILSVPAKDGVIRNISNSPGVMERSPVWSPDGQSIAYFSDESGLYALHVAAQTGASDAGDRGKGALRTYKLDAEPTYYFDPLWSPDSKKIAFRDNKLNTLLLDLVTGKLTRVADPDSFGGFAASPEGMAWSPDSAWLAFPRTAANHFQVLMLHAVATGKTMQLTDTAANVSFPTFDRSGKYLYFLASNDAGATRQGLDMSSNLYRPTASIYALALARGTGSPVAPEANDEKLDSAKPPAEKPEKNAKPGVPPVIVDLAGLAPAAIARRISVLPLPPGEYRDLQAGKPGTLFLLSASEGADSDEDAPAAATLKRWTIEGKKTTTLAENVERFEVSANGEKLLVGYAPIGPPPAPGSRPQPSYAIAGSDAPLKPGDAETRLKLDGLAVRVDPPAEWTQMFREIWRIQRSYFYDPNFHGYDMAAAEKRLQPYLAGVQSRSDLNYVFQEMLTGLSVGHLRGSGGAIPAAKRVPGGLLGADFEVRNNRHCITKIYDGGSWSPDAKAPLAQPGLNLSPGDCIVTINGNDLTAATDIQQPLEGMARQAVILGIAPAAGGLARQVTVVPIASELQLRNLDWIDGNRRRVDELSGGKLAYVYLPDTGRGGFTSFNRYFFAQTDKSGVIIDDRFNGGGQAADYIVDVLARKTTNYFQPRYGATERTPYAAIPGPKVMVINESAGSGGDMLPWLFRDRGLGPLVGKRTWGGLVGIGPIPPLIDGGSVTSPSVGFFNPKGEWEVENHGVEPDHRIDQAPALVARGEDPQLDTAVALAMEALKKTPPVEPRRPAYPVYPLPPGK